MFVLLVLGLLLLVALGACMFAYAKLVSPHVESWRDRRLYSTIFEAHERVGYPVLGNQEQFAILDRGDLSSIERLTEHAFVPRQVLERYITISPVEYYRHLMSREVQERLDLSKAPDALMDGHFIEKRGSKFLYVYNERRDGRTIKAYDRLEELVWFIAYDRLRMYAPKYKRTMSRHLPEKLNGR